MTATPEAARLRSRVLALAAYVASVAWVLRGAWGRAVGAGVDLPGTLWFHGFVADCLAELRLPTRTDAFFAPDGKDVFADTGANVLDALLAAPFLAILGSPAHMAPFVGAVLVGNAVAMHALLRSLRLGTAAVVAGSVAYAVGPSVLHELDGGRPTQALLWFWPLALRELVRMREDPRWRRPVLAGVFVALQAWTYWFTGHVFAVVFAPALLTWGLLAPGRLVATSPSTPEGPRGAPRAWLLRLGVAGGIALLAVAPAAVPMALRLARGHVPDGAGLTHARQALDPDAWWILAPWASNLHIPTSYLVLLGLGLLACRRRSLWGVAAVLGVLFAAGPRLAVADGSLANPVWTVATLLPGLDRLLFPARAWPALALLAAAALAEALDRLRPPVAVLGAVAVVGAVHAAHPAPVRSTEVVTPAYVAAVASAPGTVLDLPHPCGHLVVHLQPLHGQPMVGGMAEHVRGLRPPALDARIAASPLLGALVAAAADAPVTAAAHAPAAAALGSAERPFRWVVLHEDVYADPLAGICLGAGQRGASAAARARARLLALLGPPTVSDERATAWDLEAR